MVTESVIEKVIEKFESNQEAYVNALANLMEKYPTLLAYLGQESNDVLLEEEKDILWYLSLVIISSAEDFLNHKVELSDQELSENEESNWAIYQEQKKPTFREKITIFFNDYEQEDLLAFVEDTVELDEESPITGVGREVLFISAKSLIDSMFPEK